MTANIDSSKLSILHVLTLNGRNGEYGGPVRVARELCTELNSRGNSTHIFSGVRRGSEPTPWSGLSESYVLVKPIFRKLAVSSLWSWKLIKPLNKLIKSSDIVHIHFARDLIPFLAGLISILHKKPFIAQTHGMVIVDGRLSTKLVDFLLTKPILNKSKRVLVLTENEKSDAVNLKLKSQLEILPNGINIDQNSAVIKSQEVKIIFCSRLERRKRVDRFIELASRFQSKGFIFEIYGPDGGDLEFVINEITSRNLKGCLQYKGSLQSSEVQEILKQAHLLVLPSENEPFPMIVLEALSVGTSVLVMPSCGISGTLLNYDSRFVSPTEDIEGLVQTFQRQFEVNFQNSSNEIGRAHV